jgi:hypothetical protein
MAINYFLMESVIMFWTIVPFTEQFSCFKYRPTFNINRKISVISVTQWGVVVSEQKEIQIAVGK